MVKFNVLNLLTGSGSCRFRLALMSPEEWCGSWPSLWPSAGSSATSVSGRASSGPERSARSLIITHPRDYFMWQLATLSSAGVNINK